MSSSTSTVAGSSTSTVAGSSAKTAALKPPSAKPPHLSRTAKLAALAQAHVPREHVVATKQQIRGLMGRKKDDTKNKDLRERIMALFAPHVTSEAVLETIGKRVETVLRYDAARAARYRRAAADRGKVLEDLMRMAL